MSNRIHVVIDFNENSIAHFSSLEEAVRHYNQKIIQRDGVDYVKSQDGGDEHAKEETDKWCEKWQKDVLKRLRTLNVEKVDNGATITGRFSSKEANQDLLPQEVPYPKAKTATGSAINYEAEMEKLAASLLDKLKKKTEEEMAKMVAGEYLPQAYAVNYDTLIEGENATVEAKPHPVLDVEPRLVMADAFQDAVLENADTNLRWYEQVINAALGLGEAGEVLNDIKKYYFHPSSELFHNRELLEKFIEDELGDLFFYGTWLAKLFGKSVGDVMKRNVRKLKERHAETGGFPKTSERDGFSGSALEW